MAAPNDTRRNSLRYPTPAAGPSTPPVKAAFTLAAQTRAARRGVPVADGVIRVVLVDDHAILRDGVRALLQATPDIQVVGEAGDGNEAVAVARRSAPHVVVLDLDMPRADGATATVALSRLDPAPKVLILSMHEEDERVVPLLENGARGYLSKDCAHQDLVDAIRVVAAGNYFVRPAVARILAANVISKRQEATVDADRRQLDLLSVRERSVLQRVAQGYSGVEIARMLAITPKTIDTYKNRIGEKLGFTHRTEYVRFALRLGLIDDGQLSRDTASHLEAL